MELFRRPAGATSFHGKKRPQSAGEIKSLRASLLRTVTKLTTAQGPKREWFHNETGASEIADFLIALAPVFVRIFWVTRSSESSPRRENLRHAVFLPRGAKSNGEKDVVGHNRKRGLLHECHFCPAVAYTCQGSRRVPWHMQPDRDLLRHVFLLQGILCE
jgi:hypothetical protein